MNIFEKINLKLNTIKPKKGDSDCIIKSKMATYDEMFKASSPEDLATILGELKWEEQEHLGVITLNSTNNIIKVHEITKGLVNQTPYHPREIFKPAITDNATAIILFHNHPSGSTDPSPEDMAMTKNLVTAGKIMMLPVIEHIIIGMRGFYSFARSNTSIIDH